MSKSSNKLVCAANPCPITLSAACVFYEGPNLVCSGVSTNMTVENALQEINKRLEKIILDLHNKNCIDLCTYFLQQRDGSDNSYMKIWM